MGVERYDFIRLFSHLVHQRITYRGYQVDTHTAEGVQRDLIQHNALCGNSSGVVNAKLMNEKADVASHERQGPPGTSD